MYRVWRMQSAVGGNGGKKMGLNGGGGCWLPVGAMIKCKEDARMEEDARIRCKEPRPGRETKNVLR
jgi:hypothetical protein